MRASEGDGANNVEAGTSKREDLSVTEPVFDLETRATINDHHALRLWLRWLSCTARIENQIRARLRQHFETTLPRFDLMAQLERNAQGLRMGEISERLMVTGGNVTGITDQLVADGLVERVPIPEDGRAFVVRLTARGKRQFDAMAAAHERWIIELLGVMSPGERDRLYSLLDGLKRGLQGGSVAAPRATAKRARVAPRRARGPR